MNYLVLVWGHYKTFSYVLFYLDCVYGTQPTTFFECISLRFTFLNFKTGDLVLFSKENWSRKIFIQKSWFHLFPSCNFFCWKWAKPFFSIFCYILNFLCSSVCPSIFRVVLIVLNLCRCLLAFSLILLVKGLFSSWRSIARCNWKLGIFANWLTIFSLLPGVFSLP